MVFGPTCGRLGSPAQDTEGPSSSPSPSLICSGSHVTSFLVSLSWRFKGIRLLCL